MGLKGNEPGNVAPPAGTHGRVFTPIWGLGFDLDSLVPYLGDALGVVGKKLPSLIAVALKRTFLISGICSEET